MLALFLALFSASIIFITIFLILLPSDIKKQSLRPLFLLLASIAFWIATMPALWALEPSTVATYAAYNVVESNATASLTFQFPLSSLTNQVQVIPLTTYNAFFYIWLGLLTFLFFMLLLWFLLLLREKASEVLRKGRDTMEELDLKLI